MRFTVTWTPRETIDSNSATSKLTIYDAGEYTGFLIDTGSETIWRCWRVIERTTLAGAGPGRRHRSCTGSVDFFEPPRQRHFDAFG